MGWQVEFLGETFSEDDLTLDQLGRLEETTNIRHGWYEEVIGLGDPKKAEIAASLKLYAALLADKLGCSMEDATAKVGALKKSDVEVRVVDDLPKEYEGGFPPPAGEGSTDT